MSTSMAALIAITPRRRMTSGELEISTGRRTILSLYRYSSLKKRLRALFESVKAEPDAARTLPISTRSSTLS
jgi:hypothetical protein